MNNNLQKPQAGEESAETRLLSDGVDSDILFTALDRQRMPCGGYMATNNPITVRLGPKVWHPVNGTQSDNARSAADRDNNQPHETDANSTK